MERNKLDNPNSNAGFMNMFRRPSISNGNGDQDIKKLVNENLELKKEVELHRMKNDEKCQDFDNIKNEYQIIINLQVERIKKYDIKLAENNTALEELNKKFNQINDKMKVLDSEKSTFENKYLDIRKELKIKEETIEHYENEILNKSQKIEFYEECLSRQAKESAELANKLAELKNAIMEDNIINHNFKGQKLGIIYNSSIDITFSRSDDNIYFLILNEYNKLEHVNVEDIDYIKKNVKYSGIDLSYFKNLKNICITLLFSDDIVDKILKIYHDYLQKSIMSNHYKNK